MRSRTYHTISYQSPAFCQPDNIHIQTNIYSTNRESNHPWAAPITKAQKIANGKVNLKDPVDRLSFRPVGLNSHRWWYAVLPHTHTHTTSFSKGKDNGTVEKTGTGSFSAVRRNIVLVWFRTWSLEWTRTTWVENRDWKLPDLAKQQGAIFVMPKTHRRIKGEKRHRS